MDTRTRRDGREIENVGTYDPMVKETDARALLNGERIDYWLGVGAKPSPKVGTLIKKYGTNGTHLEQQNSALEKLGGKRAASIAAAVTEAESTKVVAASEETASEEAASSDAAATEETAEATATEGGDAEGATEAAAEENTEATAETPAAEASDDAAAEEKPAE